VFSLNLNQEIEICQLCIQYAKSNKIDYTAKPYNVFQVEKLWLPSKVTVLFLAESPPWSRDRYFYKTDMTGNKVHLQKEVLGYLNLASLSEFKAKGYFLIDAIKCRLNKQTTEHVPARILCNCTNCFLQKELDRLNPSAIFVLGNSAKHALEHLVMFKELKSHKISEDFDGMIAGRRVILCVYPGGKTRIHVSSIKHSFEKLKEEGQ
jgi:uracil-DNA glycosylase